VQLVKDRGRGQQPFIIRAPGKLIARAQVEGGQRRLRLGRLPHPARQEGVVRCRHVLYHSQGRDCAFSSCNLFGADGASFFHGEVFCEYHLESLKVILPTTHRLRVVFDGPQQ